ncbi:lamin tail domain-containing protein [Haloferula sp. A504]|uniref:lamin tail domain-containing protein n=1 Tax=Haloferula sp. A504 TaxID=3373601 RepID=UPI0031C084EE|nr:lamin tail domain-containing protein [Verrucomicrobiaceae bacterium E54]
MRTLPALVFAAFGFQATHALNPGDIAFTGFNVDGDDDFAIVALVDIPPSTTIHFTDNESDGAGGLNTGEGAISWTSDPSPTPAGTVVVFTDTASSSTLTASLGTLVDGTGGMNLAAGGDAIFAFEGPNDTTVTTFLAAVANEAGNFGDLTGSGLTEGTTAFTFTTFGNPDGGEYSGARSGQATFADYIPLIADPFNWTTEDSDGEASLPFDSTPFTTGGAAPVQLFLFLTDFEISESGGSTTLSVFRDGPTTSAATVTLTSNDTGEATVPLTADFLVGEDTVDVTVTAVDDSIFDGPQTVTFTAAGVGFFDGTADLTVNDDFADNADLIINEIYPNNFDLDLNGDGIANGADEFIELVNTSGSPLDISGWTISDESSLRHTFAPGTILGTDCAILVFDELPPTTTGIDGTQAVAASTGSLSLNPADTLTIQDNTAAVVMTCSYDSPFAPTALDSVNLESDATPGPYTDHSFVVGSGGAQLSPGTKVDGSAFCTQPILTLSASPTSFTENTAGTASTGTVTATPAPTNDLIVTLTSGDTTEAIVPATVTILANDPSATFPITAADDLEVDGDIVVTLAASATGYVGDTSTVTVQDDGDTVITPNLSPGSIAFTGFNSDGGDNLAFVALQDIDAGQVIFFTDDEWDGGAVGAGGGFVDSNEGTIRWTSPIGGVPSGTIVLIDEPGSSATISTNIGVAAVEDSQVALSTSGDTLYAYQGSDFRTVTSFVALISSEGAPNLTGTGLTSGTTAVLLPDSTDGGVYSAGRSISPTFAGYLPLIGDVAGNWTLASDGASLVPFDTTAFTLGTADPYDTWADSKGLTPSNNGAEDDAENGGSGDGIANVLEFILGGDPLAVDPSILPTASTDNSDFIFTFNRSDESESVTTATFQWVADLDFSGANIVPIGAISSPADGNGVTVTVEENGSAVDTITVRVPKTNAPAGALFGRLTGTRP